MSAVKVPVVAEIHIARENPAITWAKGLSVGDKVENKGYVQRQKSIIAEMRQAMDSIIPQNIATTRIYTLCREELLSRTGHTTQSLSEIVSNIAGVRINLTTSGERRMATRSRTMPTGVGIRFWNQKKTEEIPIWTKGGANHDRRYTEKLAWVLEEMAFQQNAQSGSASYINAPILATGVGQYAISELNLLVSIRQYFWRFQENGRIEITPKNNKINYYITLTGQRGVLDAHIEDYDGNYKFSGTTLKLYGRYKGMIPDSVIPGLVGRAIPEFFDHPAFAEEDRIITSVNDTLDEGRPCLMFGISAPRRLTVMELSEKINA